MRRSCLFAVSVASLLSSACTHIETKPDYSTAGFGEAVTGIPYALPALRYKLAVTSNIAACPTELQLGGRQISDGGFSLATKVVPTATYVPGERYIADYDALTSPFKTTGFAIETYPSGILKSVNVSAEDQSGPFIKDVVSIGLSIAGLGGGLKSAPRSLTFTESSSAQLEVAIKSLLSVAPKGAIVCKPTTADGIRNRKLADTAADTASASLERATKAVVTWTTVNASRRANRSDLLELKKALEEQAIAQSALEKAKEERDKARGGLSLSAEALWPTQIIAFHNKQAGDPQEIGLDDRDIQVLADLVELRDIPIVTRDKFAAWWNQQSDDNRRDFVKAYGPVAQHYGATPGSDLEVTEVAEPIVCAVDRIGNPRLLPNPCLKRELSFSGALRLIDRPAVGTGKLAISGIASHQGILIRTAQKADFTLCRAVKPNCGRKDQVAYETGVSAPQFGQLRLLPFKNRMFEAAQLALALREDGSLEKFEYKRTKAIAGEAAAVVKDAIGQYEAFREKQEKKAAETLTAARAEDIANLDYQIAMLTKRAEIVKLQSPKTPDAQQAVIDETTQINAEVALLNAKLARLKAEAALASGGAGADE